MTEYQQQEPEVKDEPGEIVTCGRICHVLDPGLADDSYAEESRKIRTMVDIAELLDDAVDASAEERGCHGAAHAHAQIGFDDGTFEDFEDLDHPALLSLPSGTPRDARRALRRREGHWVWNGRNHVTFSTTWLTQCLTEIRATSPTKAVKA